jgi:rod shape-determining protein MreC
VRTLFILIRKFRNLLLFLLLEIISIVLIVQTRNIQGADILSSSNSIAGFFYKQSSNISYYFKLKGVNDELVAENARLRNEIGVLTGIDTYQIVEASIPVYQIDSVKKIDSIATIQNENGDVVYKYVGDKKLLRYNKYQYLPARVVNNSITNDVINYITINKGEAHGVRKGMAVVSSNGIVGRVANTSKNYATIVSVISSVSGNGKNNAQLKVSAQLQDGTIGLATWKSGNPDYLIMEKLSLSANLKVGDPVYTTGHSYFPSNLTIGHIARVDTMENTNTKSALLKLSTNFRKLSMVYVVTNEYDNERKELEAKNED